MYDIVCRRYKYMQPHIASGPWKGFHLRHREGRGTGEGLAGRDEGCTLSWYSTNQRFFCFFKAATNRENRDIII